MTPTQQKAKAAAERMMRERGALVIGILSSYSQPINRGDVLPDFAGVVIPGKQVRIARKATFADWEAQAALLGIPNRHPRMCGRRFFFAHLIDDPDAERDAKRDRGRG